MDDKFSERRVQKHKNRQKKWEERQERSKVTRDEIQKLISKRDALHMRLEKKFESSDANTVDDDNDEEKAHLFTELPLSQRTQMGLERGNYTKMTPIQRDSLFLSLADYDVLGAAKTGSGKTLCYVIPVLEKLLVEHWDAEMGLGALILSPTRELALQIFKVLQVVGYKHVFSAALLTGGRDVEEEKKRLRGISIIVGTPGRVLHHLQDTAEMVVDNLQLLVMDEADRLLDMGFRESLTNIIKYLPQQRQTLLFSATQTTDVDMLAQLSLRNPRYVTSQRISLQPTPSTLSHNFVVLELNRKLDALLMFLKKHPHDKVVIFFSTCNQVKYMYLAFSRILKKMRIPSMCLTSKMKQFRREEVFLTFCRCKSAALFCTDVAARGLDFPLVHWVIQYDCPESPQTYIHRAGRTARAGAKGATILFLTPTETPMLSYLANKNIPMREIAIKPSMLQNSQEIFVALVVQGLKYEAQKAFIAYLRSVYFAQNKHVFDIKSIDVEKFAKSLGLLVVPDMSDLQSMHRSAKNLPWSVVNYITARKKNGDVEGEEDGEGAKQNATPLTRKEKHLKASDMFRMMEQKQKFAPKDNPLGLDVDSDDDDGDFLKKVTKTPEESSAAKKDLELTAEERISGLSKNKLKRFVENADLRVRDLGLTKVRRVADSDDDEEEEVEKPEKAVSEEESSEQSDSGNEDEFAENLRQRISSTKESDHDRAKQMRHLRRLQKVGRVSRKDDLEKTGIAVGQKRSVRSDDDSDDYNSSDSNDSSLVDLIREAQRNNASYEQGSAESSEFEPGDQEDAAVEYVDLEQFVPKPTSPKPAKGKNAKKKARLS
ncbi:ATP-dependent RNA helicase DDX10/DBP4 [Angomonas deanei]|nr:ATP-dependent RNA helicase DDX10/DBP4 [Angomonas deanei]|eukprot:EPY43187.1 ATP-dependent RNA helicase DDX10/DBP4 [Angomonas deanei]